MRVTAALAVFLVTSIVAVPPARGQAQTLEQIAETASDYLELVNPLTGDWADRRDLFDLFDVAMQVPPDLAAHPLANPALAEWIAHFHRIRMDRVLDALTNGSPVTSGVRLHKLYSSGWVIQSPNATIAVDFTENIINGNLAGVPGTTVPQMAQLAQHIDAFFMTHGHLDHISAYLAYAMTLLGKPVYVTTEMLAALSAAAIPIPPTVQAPPHDQTVTLGGFSFITYHGAQFGGFLDPPGNTIPNPATPGVQNSCFLFDFAGTTVAHFGDNNNLGILAWLVQKIAAGWDVEIALNLGAHAMAINWIAAPLYRFHTHDLEFSHPYGVFLPLNQTPAFNPSRVVLMWGESFDVDP